MTIVSGDMSGEVMVSRIAHPAPRAEGAEPPAPETVGQRRPTTNN
eukprot:SAG11_NODE_28563_length_320_cov_0.932127_1_plen_44_part_01